MHLPKGSVFCSYILYIDFRLHVFSYHRIIGVVHGSLVRMGGPGADGPVLFFIYIDRSVFESEADISRTLYGTQQIS